MKVLEVKPGIPESFVIPPGTDRVQFCRPLSNSEYQFLGSKLCDRPEVQLRVYHSGPGRHFANIDFLLFFPAIRRLSIQLFWLVDIEGFDAVEDLDELTFGWTEKTSYSLRFLQRFKSIRKLYVEGHKKDIDVLTSLPNLRTLTLRSITLPSAALLARLPNIRRLAIKLGGTSNLSDLSQLTNLTSLELWQIRSLKDVSFIGKLRSLETLHLESLKNVTKLPSLKHLSMLKGMLLENMKGVTDLSPVADAPSLERLILYRMGGVDLNTLRSFVGHPALRQLIPDLGTLKRNAYAEELFGLLDDGMLKSRAEGGAL